MRTAKTISSGVVLLYGASHVSAQVGPSIAAASEILSNLDVSNVGTGARAEGLGVLSASRIIHF